MRTQKGFTLVELVVILLLIGILAVFVAPKLIQSNYNEAGFYREIVAAIKYAQKYAVATGCDVRVDLRNNQYRLFQRRACAANNWNNRITVAHPSTGQAFEGSPPTGVAFNPGRRFFQFDAMGRPVNNAGNPIPSFNVGVGSFNLTVQRESGFVVPQ